MYEHNAAASLQTLQSDKFAVSILKSCILIHSAVWYRLFKSEFYTKCDLVLPFFNLQYPLFSLRSSNICLRLLPLFRVSHVLPSIFHSIIFLVDSCHARSSQSSQLSFFIFFRTFLSSLTLVCWNQQHRLKMRKELPPETSEKFQMFTWLPAPENVVVI